MQLDQAQLGKGSFVIFLNDFLHVSLLVGFSPCLQMQRLQYFFFKLLFLWKIFKNLQAISKLLITVFTKRL